MHARSRGHRGVWEIGEGKVKAERCESLALRRPSEKDLGGFADSKVKGANRVMQLS